MAGIDESLIGISLGPYTLRRLIGRGGMGIVYEAVHVHLGKRVALKILHPRYADHPDASKRFEREARVAAQLRHPHVINVFDVGHEAGCAFLAMDLVEGPTLAQRLAERGPLSLREIADIFLPVASAITAAHEAGVVHRDLKPANILLAEPHPITPWPVVVDFSISKLIDEEDTTTRSDAIIGSLPYLPPERAHSPKAASPEGDQYAFGIMLYESATGRRPFAGVSAYDLLHAIVTTTPAGPSQLDPALPTEFDRLVLRAMSRDPEARFPSMRALASELLSFGGRRAWIAWGGEFAITGGDGADGVTSVEQGLGSSEIGGVPRARATTTRRSRRVTSLAGLLGMFLAGFAVAELGPHPLRADPQAAERVPGRGSAAPGVSVTTELPAAPTILPVADEPGPAPIAFVPAQDGAASTALGPQPVRKHVSARSPPSSNDASQSSTDAGARRPALDTTSDQFGTRHAPILD